VPLIGVPVTDTRVRDLLRDLDVRRRGTKVRAGVLQSVVADRFGIALNFETKGEPEVAVRLSYATFARSGYKDGPGYVGPLPHGFDFGHSREECWERLGPPARYSPEMRAARWEWGHEYVVAEFAPGEDGISKVKVGRSWQW
jgi:hypothetical protein